MRVRERCSLQLMAIVPTYAETHKRWISRQGHRVRLTGASSIPPPFGHDKPLGPRPWRHSMPSMTGSNIDAVIAAWSSVVARSRHLKGERESHGIALNDLLCNAIRDD